MIRTWEQQQALEQKSRKKWLQKLADMGHPIVVSADLAGIPAPSLSNMAIRLGVKFVKADKGKPEIVTKAKLQDCASKGMTTAESARALGVSAAAIYHARIRHGITMPVHAKFQKRTQASA